MDQQFDLSAKERDVVLQRAALRSSLRAEFLKKTSNPHIHGEGGYIFDPATQRWLSMRANHWHWFKPTKQTAWPAIMVFGLCISYGHLLKVRRARREANIRAGNVSYADRPFKFF